MTAGQSRYLHHHDLNQDLCFWADSTCLVSLIRQTMSRTVPTLFSRSLRGLSRLAMTVTI